MTETAVDPTPAPTSPAETEATGAEMIPIEFMGTTLELPASVEDWDADALGALERGQAVVAIQTLLGEEGYPVFAAAFRRVNKRKPTVRDMGNLMDLIAATYGFDSLGG